MRFWTRNTRAPELRLISEQIKDLFNADVPQTIDRYIISCRDMDHALETPGAIGSDIRIDYDLQHDMLFQKTELALAKTAVALRLITGLQLNGNLSEKVRSTTRPGFMRMKKQQTGLLACIADEVEFIRCAAGYERRIRDVLKQHNKTLHQAGHLMEIIMDRIKDRPTTLLRLNTKDKKLLEMEEPLTPDTVRLSNDQARNNQPDRSIAPCNAVICGRYDELKDCRKKIAGNLNELRKGFDMLSDLFQKGYSFRMKKCLDALTGCHDLRTREFEKQVLESRLQYASQP